MFIMGSSEENALLPMEHRSLELLDGDSIYDMGAYKTVNERGAMSANILTSGVDYSKAAPSSPLLPFHPPDPDDLQWQIDTQADRGINDILRNVQAIDIWTNLNDGFDGISNEIESSLKNDYESSTFQPESSRTSFGVKRLPTTNKPRSEETTFTPSKRISWPSSDVDPFTTVRSPLKVGKRPTWKTKRKKRLRRFKKPSHEQDPISLARRKKRRFRGSQGKRAKRPRLTRGERQSHPWSRSRPQKLLRLSSAPVPLHTRSSGYLSGGISRSSLTSEPETASRSLRPLVINGIFRVSTQSPLKRN